MSDNITLPREVVQEAVEALGRYATDESPEGWHAIAALNALRAALAAPEPEPVLAQHRFRHPRKGSPNWGEWHECSVRNRPAWEIDSQGYEVEYRPLYTAPPAAAPTVKESLTHPGYIIGNHWLETAYERLCAGESEDAILEDYELVREPRLRDLRRDAERYRWLRGEHSRIDPCIKAVCKHPLQRQGHTWAEIHDLDAIFDAAMGDKT